MSLDGKNSRPRDRASLTCVRTQHNNNKCVLISSGMSTQDENAKCQVKELTIIMFSVLRIKGPEGSFSLDDPFFFGAGGLT